MSIDITCYDDVTQLVSFNEDQKYYSSDVMIDTAKARKLAKHDAITIKSGENIKTAILKSIFGRLSRENIIYLGKFVQEHPIEISQADGLTGLNLVTNHQLSERLAKISDHDRSKISYLHIGTIQIILKSTFKEMINSPIDLAIIDNRIKTSDCIIGIIQGNLAYQVIKFNVNLNYAIPLESKNITNSIGILYKFHNKELMEKGDHPFSITYAVGYCLTNSHHSIDYIKHDKIIVDKLFDEVSTRNMHFSFKNDKTPFRTLKRTPSSRIPTLKLTSNADYANTSIGALPIQPIRRSITLPNEQVQQIAEGVSNLTEIINKRL
ncbi:putative cell-to-cell movement protein [Rudbeckia flower distortion virus]|uniref:Putative cell-to-cell movement protein n=1 Tax=Rudbeckia flower distortion virus TaxID=587370 RepID=B8Y868_9VIRU|nr:putative cell-to-cell movement protein [Rudbeckia flower distortion virus]ACL36979.1 putative cell-to-cell movement protein [Rudbeckia flower distortion virus]